ncbi:hypothetical protein Tco_0727471 [Tanacetum coccineum]|uniref:Uncharacterized protein n=1 Tax=Tanacetum coccineum TaxID=301880 RepID=A0ABQ4YKR3_9ASTR
MMASVARDTQQESMPRSKISEIRWSRVTPSDIQYSAAYLDLRVLQIGIRAKVIENQLVILSAFVIHIRVYDILRALLRIWMHLFFPTSVASSEESHNDTVDIGVDRVHPVPVAEVAFPAATVEIFELENTSLLGRIKTLEAINTLTHDQEKRTRRRMEQQLASVEETLRGMRIEMESLRTQQRQSVRALEPHDAPEDADSHTAETDMYQVVSTETKKMDKYISGLPDNVYGNVKFSKPKTLDETIELSNELMDQKLRIYAERQTDNKRKADDLSRNNHSHQQKSFKKQNVAKTYAVGSDEEKEPTRTLATLMMKSKL